MIADDVGLVEFSGVGGYNLVWRIPRNGLLLTSMVNHVGPFLIIIGQPTVKFD